MGESAAQHRALKRATDPHQETAKSALIHVGGDIATDSADDSIRASDEQTAEDRVDVESDQAMTEKALGLLERPSPTTYLRASIGNWRLL